MQAGALNCPNCGAAVSTDAPNCPYCSARLQTVACSRCHAMMWLGSKFCPHCGAAAEPVDSGPRTDLPCPRCNTRLVGIAFAQARADECPTCRGLWIRPGDFERICTDAAQRVLADGSAIPVAPTNPANTRDRYPPCPVCSQRMAQVNYAHRSGVMINLCRDHGFWLDADELRQIIEFVRSGGLDRARRLEQERLDAARRKLALDRASALPDPADPQARILRDFFGLDGKS